MGYDDWKTDAPDPGTVEDDDINWSDDDAALATLADEWLDAERAGDHE
jgi:hypothetical protein